MLYLSGEALPVDLATRLQSHCPHLTVWNRYGPAECTVDVTMGTAAIRGQDTVVSIGSPLPNSVVAVLKRRAQGTVVVPLEVPGEICLSGHKVAMGYLGRPDLTATSFCIDPAQQYGRMYYTGDRGRWLQNGSLEFLGRIDFQVKPESEFGSH